MILEKSNHNLGSGPWMALLEQPAFDVYRNWPDMTLRKSPGCMGIGHGGHDCPRGRGPLDCSLIIWGAFKGYEAYVNSFVALWLAVNAVLKYSKRRIGRR